MTKLHVFKSNQAIMTRLGLYSYNLTDPRNEFFHSFISYYLLCQMGIFTVTGSFAFVFINWPQLDVVAQPFAIAFGASVCFCTYLCTGLKMKTIKLLHLKLQEMVDKGNFFLYKNYSIKII